MTSPLPNPSPTHTRPTPAEEPGFDRQAGLWVRRGGLRHRAGEYEEQDLDLLRRMQQDHFWYRGRYRFLLAALRRHLRLLGRSPATLRALDLGAGCGGWVQYLARRLQPAFHELALADSSPAALATAAALNGPDHACFLVDVCDLGWRARWDVIFLLDVLEHLPDQRAVLEQVRESLAPGGLLVLTVPALRCFWSLNDELVHHQRRYARADLHALAAATGLALRQTRYFMFWLSPLLWASRFVGRAARPLSPADRERWLDAAHRIPPRWLNGLLAAVFAAETPWGVYCPFPWGTSLLGIYQRT